MTELQKSDALIIVDLQRDFLPSGALAVALGDTVIAVMNRYALAFSARRLPIFATRDWHPPDHCSFVSQGGPWPPHCVAGTPGAEFASTLALAPGTEIISKGVSREAEGYSGFESTTLEARLRALGAKRIFVGGLATDYCVRATALDALRGGLDVVVLEDAVRPVDVRPGDGERALQELVSSGAKRMRLESIGV